MKHAGSLAIENLSGLLAAIRRLPGLTERKPGIFYFRGKAYLHFHEDPAGLFADARIDRADFARFPVNSESDKVKLLSALRQALQK